METQAEFVVGAFRCLKITLEKVTLTGFAYTKQTMKSQLSTFK